MTSGNTSKDSERLARLTKLKALADRGIGGEKENAQMLLDKLCKTYNMSLEQVTESDAKKMHWFKPRHGKPFKKLLGQCIYKVVGMRDMYTHGNTEIGVECTAAEAIEISLEYRFYANLFDAEVGRLLHWFIQKNVIFPPDAPKVESEKEISEEDISMYMGITRRSRTLQIGKGGKS